MCCHRKRPRMLSALSALSARSVRTVRSGSASATASASLDAKTITRAGAASSPCLRSWQGGAWRSAPPSRLGVCLPLGRLTQQASQQKKGAGGCGPSPITSCTSVQLVGYQCRLLAAAELCKTPTPTPSGENMAGRQ